MFSLVPVGTKQTLFDQSVNVGSITEDSLPALSIRSYLGVCPWVEVRVLIPVCGVVASDEGTRSLAKVLVCVTTAQSNSVSTSARPLLDPGLLRTSA